MKIDINTIYELSQGKTLDEFRSIIKEKLCGHIPNTVNKDKLIDEELFLFTINVELCHCKKILNKTGKCDKCGYGHGGMP